MKTDNMSAWDRWLMRRVDALPPERKRELLVLLLGSVDPQVREALIATVEKKTAASSPPYPTPPYPSPPA